MQHEEVKDFLGFKISTLHAWKHVFTIFDSFLDLGTSSKTVSRLRGIPRYRGTLSLDHCFESFLRHVLLYAYMYCMLHFFLLLEVVLPLLLPLDQRILFLSKLGPTCSSLPLPTRSFASSSLILPHFRPLCSPNLGCQDFREGATGKGLKLEKRED